MLLPQSQAYKTLSERLATISSMQAMVGPASAGTAASAPGGKADKKTGGAQAESAPSSMLVRMPETDMHSLLCTFKAVQDSHCAARLHVLSAVKP